MKKIKIIGKVSPPCENQKIAFLLKVLLIKLLFFNPSFKIRFEFKISKPNPPRLKTSKPNQTQIQNFETQSTQIQNFEAQSTPDSKLRNPIQPGTKVRTPILKPSRNFKH